ncbi:TraR/DksA family transcriptional regulator [Yoonia maritima]|uniref:TraR/DksA family transcriptional regulator n=1 Tax=Yoonia maritima TaxID=1435347 RepID=UPI000D0F2FDD|nr:TraR/DksA family transcriptional regulator [Yoonia maritima]
MDIDTYEQTLIARRAELVGDMVEIEDQLDDPPSKDWDDRSTERQVEALGNSDLAEIKRIDAALARIKAGTYGYCQKCGEQISDARLTLLPDTPFCKTCA